MKTTKTSKKLLFLFCIALLASSCSDSKSSAAASATSTTSVASVGADPLYAYQWHLKNSGQLGGTAGIDLNVEDVWSAGNEGAGVVVMIVDDGAELDHQELFANANSTYSINYLSNGLASTNPGGATASHGTAVAGIISGGDNNAVGGRGVASGSSLAARNLIALSTSTVAQTVDALTNNISAIYVSNNSWGPADGYGQYLLDSSSYRTALTTGVTNGRSGLGAVYVWAAGNGGTYNYDNSNYDGLANHYAVISVAAMGDDGTKATYSENGANLWVTAPSQGNSGTAITTSDLTGDNGYNTSSSVGNYSDRAYTNTFNGTSAAAPMVSGVAALVVAANSALTWRDVKIILARTARQVDSTDAGWFQNGATTVTGGYNFNEKYGFGLADASAAVTMAASFTSVGGSSTLLTNSSPSSAQTVGTSITDASATGISDTITVASSGISNIEYVDVVVDITHSNWGDLTITLARSSGGYTTSATLAEQHTCLDLNTSGVSTCTVSGGQWTFGAAAFLDEPADGNWTLTVKDLATGTTGTFDSWQLKFYGR